MAINPFIIYAILAVMGACVVSFVLGFVLLCRGEKLLGAFLMGATVIIIGALYCFMEWRGPFG